MARCKRCNKNATLYNGYCAACLSVLNRQANSLIDPADDPDIAPISPEGSLDAPGSYAKMIQSKTVGVWDPKNANVDNTKAEDKPVEGKSKAADFSIVKGEFTGKDKKAFLAVFRKLYAKYNIFFKRGLYSICKKSEYQNVGGIIIEEKGGLCVVKNITKSSIDNIEPNSYENDEAVMEYDDGEEFDIGIYN